MENYFLLVSIQFSVCIAFAIKPLTKKESECVRVNSYVSSHQLHAIYPWAQLDYRKPAQLPNKTNKWIKVDHVAATLSNKFWHRSLSLSLPLFHWIHLPNRPIHNFIRAHNLFLFTCQHTLFFYDSFNGHLIYQYNLSLFSHFFANIYSQCLNQLQWKYFSTFSVTWSLANKLNIFFFVLSLENCI